MLLASEGLRARVLSLDAWARAPDAAFAVVFRRVCTALAIPTSGAPDHFSQTTQRRYFDALRIVATARLAALGETSALSKLREMASAD